MISQHQVVQMTTTDDVVCPLVSDVDTANSDLRFSTPNGATEAVGCLSIPSELPATVAWTVTDGSQATVLKIIIVDMLAKEPAIHDVNVTVSDSASEGTIVSSYEASAIFGEGEKQLSFESNDVKVTGRRGISDYQAIVYAKSRFGRILKRFAFLTTTLTSAAYML